MESQYLFKIELKKKFDKQFKYAETHLLFCFDLKEYRL